MDLFEDIPKIDPTDVPDVDRRVTVQERPRDWEAEKYEVAELLATKGMTLQRVSEVTGIPISAIKRWKTQPDFRKYVNDYVLEIAETLKAYRLSLYLRMIDARVEKIEEMGDYSLLSTKDTLEILEAMRRETEKSEDKEQTQYLKTITALIDKSPSTIEITHRGDKSE